VSCSGCNELYCDTACCSALLMQRQSQVKVVNFNCVLQQAAVRRSKFLGVYCVAVCCSVLQMQPQSRVQVATL